MFTELMLNNLVQSKIFAIYLAFAFISPTLQDNRHFTQQKNNGAHAWDIQGKLWKITDGAGLTQTDIDLMNSWD
jgi:hypothetical protein